MSETEFVPRSVLLVTLYIIEELPEDQVEFKGDLTHFLRRTLFYTPPEDMFIPRKWNLLHDIVTKHISKPETPWQERIIDIYIGKIAVPVTE
jgi:hypothetical protein